MTYRQRIFDFLKSNDFRNLLCFIFFSAVMTVIISSQNFFFQQIIENGVSKQDIVAQKNITVVDTIRTEQHKKEVARRIDPILTQANDDFIRVNLTSLRNTILKIRGSNISDAKKMEQISVLFDISRSADKASLIEFLAKSDVDSYNKLFSRAQNTLDTMLNIGITAEDFEQDKIKDVIQKSMYQSIPRGHAKMITAILNQIIVPNLIVDEVATNIAKQNAQNSVKPYEVTFKKGDLIVFKGEEVGKLKKDALREAGYNVLEINYIGIAGIFFLVAFSTSMFLLYLKSFEKQFFEAGYLRLLAFMSMVVALVSVVLPTGFSPYIIPFPAFMIIMSIFTNPRIALFAANLILANLAIGLHYGIEVVAAFVLLNAFSMIAVSNNKFSKRNDMIFIGFKIAVAGGLILACIYTLECFLMNIDNALIISDIGYIILNAFGIGGFLTLGCLPVLEKVFRMISPYGLVELADQNQQLLKDLQLKAPGTYNHSMMVAYLCEAAAEAVGANPLLAKVGAIYHDVGKLKRPMFFVENQSSYGIENPHNNCSPKFSKMLITAHPKDGVELAKDNGLPAIINNFILQHHGTGLVTYFYNQAVAQEGAENVVEEQFRYSGPKPNTKETAILMIADAVESAVRAIKASSAEEIDSVIERIIKERLNDGQLSEAPLTLKDLSLIASTMSRIIRGIHHERIKYQQDLVNELDKNRNAVKTIDKDLEAKIQELESKRDEH